MKIYITGLLLAVSVSAQSQNYKYSDLIIQDYDYMNAEVHKRVQKALDLSANDGGEHEAVEQLRDALKLIFSRPNGDNMVAKLTPDVRRELSGFSAFEDTISGLAAEELATVKNDHEAKVQRATALFVLQNLLSEIRPEVAKNQDLRRVVQRIAEAKVKIADDVKKELKGRSMFMAENPTDFATQILKETSAKEKKK